MDSLIAAAARALASGDALRALNHVALRDDPPALALRGIAMAQLGEYLRALSLLRRAAQGFGAHEAVARARCVVAQAEVALAMRDLNESPRTLAAATTTLETHADPVNAAHARLVAVRRLLVLGRVVDAAAALAMLETDRLTPGMRAVARLAEAEVALRSLRTRPAQAALQQARDAAARSGVAALVAEVAQAQAALDRPAARHLRDGAQTVLRLADVEALYDSGALVLDACRHGLRSRSAWLPLARRPVLFALGFALASAWPADVDRHELIARAFRIRRVDETHRARLRVEIGRLRSLAAPFARIDATHRGFALAPHDGQDVAVLLPPVDGESAALLALLSDGAAWSTSALALALGTSQRTVQRDLAALEAAGQVRPIGQGRTRRWLAPSLAGFTTILLLPVVQPAG